MVTEKRKQQILEQFVLYLLTRERMKYGHRLVDEPTDRVPREEFDMVVRPIADEFCPGIGVSGEEFTTVVKPVLLEFLRALRLNGKNLPRKRVITIDTFRGDSEKSTRRIILNASPGERAKHECVSRRRKI